MCSLRRFGYLIASLSQSQAATSGSRRFFEYDSRRGMFEEAHEQRDQLADPKKSMETQTIGVGNKTEKNNPSAVTGATASVRDDRKLQLMKSMAQLRLEVI